MDSIYIEIRAERDGVIRGTAMPYGEIAQIAPDFRERFLAGAFGDVENADVILYQQHVRSKPLARAGGGGLELKDSPQALSIRARLPDTPSAREVKSLIDAKVLRGFSVGFNVVDESWDGDLRTIKSAEIVEVSIVDKPAYPGALIERARAERALQNGGRRWNPVVYL